MQKILNSFKVETHLLFKQKRDTKSVEERKMDHLQKAKSNNGSFFHDAIATYGSDAFYWETIDTANTMNELAAKEKYYIDYFDSKDKGYNNDCGGGFLKTVYQFSSSGKLIGEWASLELAAKSVLGKKKGVSNACLGYNRTYKGCYWSYDRNFTPSKDSRKKGVYQYSMDGGLIAKYESVSDASRQIGMSKSSISRVCRKERIQSGGYIWKYW